MVTNAHILYVSLWRYQALLLILPSLCLEIWEEENAMNHHMQQLSQEWATPSIFIHWHCQSPELERARISVKQCLSSGRQHWQLLDQSLPRPSTWRLIPRWPVCFPCTLLKCYSRVFKVTPNKKNIPSLLGLLLAKSHLKAWSSTATSVCTAVCTAVSWVLADV